MSIIKLPLLYKGPKGEKTMYTLFDSGTYFSCINLEYAEDIGIPIKLVEPFVLSTASEGQLIEISKVIYLDFYINDIRMCDDFMIAPGLTEQIIIGAGTLQKWRIKLDFAHDQVIVNPALARL